MTPRGLQLLYLPPFSIIARFFISALLFLNLFGLFLLYQYAKGELNLPASVHLWTLGFMGSTMLGALFQMLPVVAGATIENPLRKAFFVHTALSAGTLLLAFGLYMRTESLSLLGLLILLISLFYIVPLMLFKLLKLWGTLRDAPRGFVFALLSFLIGIILSVFLVLGHFGRLTVPYGKLLELHLSFMLFGWTATLVASVAFQVIEMFFVTPPYPKLISRYLPPFVFSLLLLKFLFPKSFITNAPIGASFFIFSLYTVYLLTKRRRKVSDPLVSLWYVGMFFLAVSCVLYPLKDELFLPFLVSFGAFVMSVIMSMMYRIIPFLVWMHLSTKGIPNAPAMFDVIHPKKIRLNFYLHLIFLASLSLLPFGIFLPSLLLLLADSLLWLFNIAGGILVYVKYERENPSHLK
ncbi:MAG: hypothetical protein GXO04_05325 [Aquificae bacterium]|nr:hypothetical protein [Aquificota bacterium]